MIKLIIANYCVALDYRRRLSMIRDLASMFLGVHKNIFELLLSLLLNIFCCAHINRIIQIKLQKVSIQYLILV